MVPPDQIFRLEMAEHKSSVVILPPAREASAISLLMSMLAPVSLPNCGISSLDTSSNVVLPSASDSLGLLYNSSLVEVRTTILYPAKEVKFDVQVQVR